MDSGQHSAIVSFIKGIADDELRDNYKRYEYRDVILPMTVIRRLDCLLESTKDEVQAMRERMDKASIADQEAGLCFASGQAFYNVSPFTMRLLLADPNQLRSNFEAYLDGFSPNVQEIIDKFQFRSQIPKLDNGDMLGSLIEKFVDRRINLSPKPVLDDNDNVKLPGLDNHGMGIVFEELIRQYNEENNEEAGEHFTPRDVVKLMANLIFLPIAKQVKSGTYLVYDGACGTGGMLTVGEEVLTKLAQRDDKEVAIHIFGQEVNDKTYAICKADLLLKGDGEEAENIKFGSTLSQDAFPSHKFDFMLSNPPYGKNWKDDLDRLGGKKDIQDPRFIVEHDQDPEFSLISRSDDGQMMFLVNMISKMKHNTSLGSRIAEVHNGSALFTGDAGQGEGNIRRWIVENDRLEAIIALPLNIFYNTPIATYIWVVTNRKSEQREGKVQLINAVKLYRQLRRNLGKKNCELADEHIKQISDLFLSFGSNEYSKIFPNEEFGFWKISVERPLRLRVDLSNEARLAFRMNCSAVEEEQIAPILDKLAEVIGPGPHMDFNAFIALVESHIKLYGAKLTLEYKKLRPICPVGRQTLCD